MISVLPRTRLVAAAVFWRPGPINVNSNDNGLRRIAALRSIVGAVMTVGLIFAGAMTRAELAVVGLPAAYVPLPLRGGEQRLNAEPVVAAGGALLVDNADLDRPGSRPS